MNKKIRQAYRRGIADTILTIVTFSFYTYFFMEVLIRICS